MTRPLTWIRSRHLHWPILLAVVLLGLAGCAAPYQTKLEFKSQPSLRVAEGTRVAAQAMQDISFCPKSQKE